MRLIDDAERRARLARRHALAPDFRVGTVDEAVHAVCALHATEAATQYLSLQARMHDFERSQYEAALYEHRRLVKQLAMRRTMFVFPRHLLGAALGGPSARVAEQERARLIKDVEKGGLAADGAQWLAQARRAVLDKLAGGPPLSAKALREELPELAGTVMVAPGKSYGGVAHLAPRVLTWLGATGELVRAANDGGWRVNRNHWALLDDWLGEPLQRLETEDAYATLLTEYLRAFGPATETDIVWWFGATKTSIRAALATVNAVPVRLEREQTGWVLDDDVDPVPQVEHWASLLPALDPTPMGWKERTFYLDPSLAPKVYDTAGNVGATAWLDGRLVGAYVQDEVGAVRLVLADDPGKAALALLDREAQRLGEWFDGERVTSMYKAPMAVDSQVFHR